MRLLPLTFLTLILIGTVLLLLPFAAFLFLYNRHFLWGFLNYLFSVGLALWMLAAHIHLRQRGDACRDALTRVAVRVLRQSVDARRHALTRVVVFGHEHDDTCPIGRFAPDHPPMLRQWTTPPP